MNTFTKILSRAAVGLTATMLLAVVGFGGVASARTPYNDSGMSTTATPVFNDFYNVPGVGDEADFVRVKPKAGGNDAYVNTLNDACNVGSSFNVRTYIHNGADPNLNNNGTGSAVAHDVIVRMMAPLNKAQNSFEFSSTVSARNAATVSDNAFLNCNNGKVVKLSLVANSVQTYSKPLGWQGAPDSSVNGTLKVGSRVQGSGDVWGCWDDRVIVVYEVKVEEQPKPVEGDGVCKDANLAIVDSDSRKVRVSITGATTGQASIVGYKINWGDGSTSNKQTDEHSYAKDGTYTVTTEVQVKLPNGTTKWVTSTNCTKKVTFKKNVPPTVTPVTPPTTVMPDTGAGDVAGIFAGTSAFGAAAHQLVTRRRRNRA